MSEMIKEFNFALTSEIQYAKDGEQVGGTFVTLMPPSRKNLSQCVVLKQAFYSTVKSMQDANPDEAKKKEGDLTGGEVIAALYMGDNDMVKVLTQAEKLFTSGVAMIDGEEKMTIPLIELMTQDDLENMVGEYLVNFILFSTLKNKK